MKPSSLLFRHFCPTNRFGLIFLLLLPGVFALRAGATPPTTPTVTRGSSVTFAAPPSDPPAAEFQWRKDGEDIIDATESTYTIFSAALSDADTFSVTAKSIAGSVTSDVAVLTVRPGELTNQAVTTGHGFVFSAGSVSGSIQWQVSTPGGAPPWTNLVDGGPYSGVTTSRLTITNATPELNHLRYRFVATDHGSVSISHPATLTVAPPFLPFPTSIAVDGAGNLFVGDASANTIQQINPARLVAPVAGTSGTSGAADGTGAGARFNQPDGLALLADGSLVVADTANATLRRIAGGGIVTTLAGRPGNRGNLDGPGLAATFAFPAGVARDANGVLYVADAMNHVIRRVALDGTVSTFAGRPSVAAVRTFVESIPAGGKP